MKIDIEFSTEEELRRYAEECETPIVPGAPVVPIDTYAPESDYLNTFVHYSEGVPAAQIRLPYDTNPYKGKLTNWCFMRGCRWVLREQHLNEGPYASRWERTPMSRLASKVADRWIERLKYLLRKNGEPATLTISPKVELGICDSDLTRFVPLDHLITVAVCERDPEVYHHSTVSSIRRSVEAKIRSSSIMRRYDNVLVNNGSWTFIDEAKIEPARVTAAMALVDVSQRLRGDR